MLCKNLPTSKIFAYLIHRRSSNCAADFRCHIAGRERAARLLLAAAQYQRSSRIQPVAASIIMVQLYIHRHLFFITNYKKVIDLEEGVAQTVMAKYCNDSESAYRNSTDTKLESIATGLQNVVLRPGGVWQRIIIMQTIII